MTRRRPSRLEEDFAFDTEFVTDRGLVALGVFLADLAHYVAWESGRAYRGHTVIVEGNGCLLVLKATKGKLPQVAFVRAETILGLYRGLWLCLHKDLLTWKTDRYAK